MEPSRRLLPDGSVFPPVTPDPPMPPGYVPPWDDVELAVRNESGDDVTGTRTRSSSTDQSPD